MLVKENPQSVADYRAGKEKVLNALVGAVMKKTRGRADGKDGKGDIAGEAKLNIWIYQFSKQLHNY